jgi:putative FmdB family regulatory protein
MPVFEYRCADCGKKFQILVGVVAGNEEEKCPNCASSNTAKLVSCFARYRSEDDRIDEIADRMEMMGEPDSPSEMRGMMREMGKAMDEDVSDEMEEMLESDMEEGGE